MLNQNLLEKLGLQVAQLATIEPVRFKAMAREVSQLDEEWSCEYAEYQSGGWKTLALYNQSRNPFETIIEDGLGLETRLLDKMPETKVFIQALGLQIMSARIARLEPRAFLWEHRDYLELENRNRLRLHVPLITNSGCYLILGGHAIHMNCGGLWMLNPTERHGACNLGHQSRDHLLIDVYACQNSNKLLAGAFLNPNSVTSLPVPKQDEIQDAFEKALTMAKLGYVTSAETTLLKFFHKFSLVEGEAYGLIIQMYEQLNNANQSAKWRGRREKYLGRQSNGTLYT